MSQAGSISGGGGGGGGFFSITGNSGGAVLPILSNINIIGAGALSIVGNPATATLTVSSTGSGGVVWNEITGVSANMAISNGYIANNVALVTLTLPAVAALGSVIEVCGKGSGGWSIAQIAGQTIHFGASSTTTGVTGSLSSTLQYDAVRIVCITADTDFVVLSSVGNLTVA